MFIFYRRDLCMGARLVSFYDLPTGVFFKAARGDTGTRRHFKINQDVIYRKDSNSTAHKIDEPDVTYYGNDFYAVVLVDKLPVKWKLRVMVVNFLGKIHV